MFLFMHATRLLNGVVVLCSQTPSLSRFQSVYILLAGVIYFIHLIYNIVLIY